jgi:hypothetical protein
MSSNLSQAVEWATIVSPASSLVVGVLTVWVLYRQVRLAREIDKSNKEQMFRLKQADVLHSLNARYEKLWDIQRRPQNDDDPQIFFMQYWSLQIDQFESWKVGLVPDSSYRVWMLQRRTDVVREWKFREMSFSQGWQICTSKIVAPLAFTQLIESVRNPVADVDAELMKIKQSYGAA